ncbi:MAG: hypothetical protein ABIW03_07580 [Sphingomicrobium sp.]
MLNDKVVLIIEDNVYLALDLSSGVEDLNGRVVGPVASATEAMQLLRSEDIAGAVVDCDIVDDQIAQLVMQLADRQIPVVFHTAAGPPSAVIRILPGVPVLREPVQPRQLLSLLIAEIEKRNDQA